MKKKFYYLVIYDIYLFQIKNVDLSVNGNYKCLVSNKLGELSSNEVTVKVSIIESILFILYLDGLLILV